MLAVSRLPPLPQQSSRWQRKSGPLCGLVPFQFEPFPVGKGSLGTARGCQGRPVLLGGEVNLTARTVLKSSRRRDARVASGPPKWPTFSPPLTIQWTGVFLGQATQVRKHPDAYTDGKVHGVSNSGWICSKLHPTLQGSMLIRSRPVSAAKSIRQSEPFRLPRSAV
jgi:hypothetical protein